MKAELGDKKRKEEKRGGPRAWGGGGAFFVYILKILLKISIICISIFDA